MKMLFKFLKNEVNNPEIRGLKQIDRKRLEERLF